MKMKISSFIVLVCSSALIITACKKDNSSNNSTSDPTIELSTQAEDQNRVASELDAAANDANTAMEGSTTIGGRVEGGGICDATIVADTLSNPRTLTISYNGTNCLGTRTRMGVIVISMPSGLHWKDAGASVTVQINNLKITRLADNKSITINGTKTMTNVTGGLLRDLSSLQHITHTITSSGLAITFDDGTQRTWQVAKQRDFTYSNNGLVISETGTHTEGNVSHVAEWGINRNGHSFTSAITTPIVVRQDCNFRIVSGQLQHIVPAVTATATFGLDANGNPVNCPTGNYFLKITWTVTGGTTKSILLPY